MTSIILELTTAEAKFLAKLLMETILWDTAPHAEHIYNALTSVVDEGNQTFAYSQIDGFFVQKKAA